MSIISHVVSAWFAFALPSYATWKALSHRPLSEPELEKWAKYWSVIGAFITFEYIAERIISWVPFYWEIKTLFLLFLSLPQTEGSTWIYGTYLAPFFTKNEADLDARIVLFQTNVLTFAKTQLMWMWQVVWSLLSRVPVTAQPGQASQNGAATGASPLDSARQLWGTYGPAFLGATRPPPQATAASAVPPFGAPLANASSVQASATTLDAQQRAPPAFPEPQHFE